MSAAYNEYVANHRFCKSMTSLYRTSARLSAKADPDDISRAQIALAVSALDRYVHERIRTGMLEIFRGTRAVTAHFDKFVASVAIVKAALASPGSDTWLDSHIRETNALKSFQKADKIADGIRLITATPLWPNVALRLGQDQGDITTRVDLIADWRNRIVHEFDADPSLPGSRFPIQRRDVQNTLIFLGRLIKAIDGIVE